MLLRTLFLGVATATLVVAMLAATQALARIALQYRALSAMRSAYVIEEARLQSRLAGALALGDPPTPPAPLSTCALLGAAGACELTVTASSQFSASEVAQVVEQGNDAVDEGRMQAIVDVAAASATGATLAERRMRIVFRTLHAAPWAVASGLDAAFESADGRQEPGDDGGFTPSSSSPGTLIDVVYRNATTGARISANVWRAATAPPAAASAPWSP